jgi:hypothetical protein
MRPETVEVTAEAALVIVSIVTFVGGAEIWGFVAIEGQVEFMELSGRVEERDLTRL